MGTILSLQQSAKVFSLLYHDCKALVKIGWSVVSMVFFMLVSYHAIENQEIGFTKGGTDGPSPNSSSMTNVTHNYVHACYT